MRGNPGDLGESGSCSGCGLRYVQSSANDRRRHRRFHDETLCGPKTRTRFSQVLFAHDRLEIVLVSDRSPKSEIDLVEKFEVIAYRDPCCYSHHFGIDTLAYDRDACCLLATRCDFEGWTSSLYRIIGLLVLVTVDRTASVSWSNFWQWDLTDPPRWYPRANATWCDVPEIPATVRYDDPYSRRLIRPLGCTVPWVVPAHRHHGVDRWLVNVAAAITGQDRTHLPFIPPFTDDGRATAMALFPKSVVLALPPRGDRNEPR